MTSSGQVGSYEVSRNSLVASQWPSGQLWGHQGSRGEPELRFGFDGLKEELDTQVEMPSRRLDVQIWTLGP